MFCPGNARLRASILTLLLGAAATSCGAGTGGKAVNFQLRVSAAADVGEQASDFVNDAGWRITLDEAKVALGPIYLWENPPAITAKAPLLQRAFEIFSDAVVPVAHAHAGDVFFSGGQVLGEMITPFVFDALGDTVTSEALNGVAGRAQSMSVELTPATLRTAGAGLGEAQARLSGTATKAGRAVPFIVELAYPGSQLDRTVNEIPLDALVDDGGVLHLAVVVPRFFRGADFDQLAADPERTADDDGHLWLTDADQPFVQLVRGVQRVTSYQPHWSASARSD